MSTSKCIEFQTFINGKWESLVVVVYAGFYYNHSQYIAHVQLFLNTTQVMFNNPEWNSAKWQSMDYYTSQWDGNWHMGLEFKDDGIIIGQSGMPPVYIFNY